MIFVNPYSKVNVDIPNMSLAYVATAHRAKVIDLNTYPRPDNAFLEEETDTFGVSVRSLNASEAARIGALYKKKYPHARIVSVGTGIDIQCCYPYMAWDDHIEIPSEFSDDYPFPDYELFDSFPLFSEKWQAGTWCYAIMTSLGCPFPCRHCMCRTRRWRPRTAANVVAELTRAKERWDICSFLVLDDCFNVSKERALDFCRQVKPLGLTWECANGLRADLFDEELARALADAGCVQVSFGIESVDNGVLAGIEKAETFEQMEMAARSARRYFARVNGFFIIGLPGSSYESDRRGLLWARDAKINAHFSYYAPPEKSLPSDEVFYGEGAHPLSDAYDKEAQQRLFNETASMRPLPPHRAKGVQYR